MKAPIKHLWFDFSETLVFLRKEPHDRVRYESYASVAKKSVDASLIKEYEELYKKYHNSNAAIFRSLGLPSNFWSQQINAIDPNELYELADPDLAQILQKIKKHVPISLFSNIHLKRILTALKLDPSWFAHRLSAEMVKEPKPALEGFYKMIELSALPAKNILYIGDHLAKDVRPAKQVGIQTGFMWGKSDEADYSFEKFEDILNIFEN